MDIKKLIREAAHGRRVRLFGGVGFNEAAEELEQLGSLILPDIEEVVRSEVESGHLESELPGQHPLAGLGHVLGTYFKLGARASNVDTYEFLLSLRGSIREEAVRSISTLWGPGTGREGEALPSALRDALIWLSSNGTDRERNLSQMILRLSSGTQQT